MTFLPAVWWRYAEADLGIVRPFVAVCLWLGGWRSERTDKLHGFTTLPRDRKLP